MIEPLFRPGGIYQSAVHGLVEYIGVEHEMPTVTYEFYSPSLRHMVYYKEQDLPASIPGANWHPDGILS